MFRTFRKIGLVCKPSSLSVTRNFSEIVKKSFNVQQGGSLLLELSRVDKSVVEITTAWQDHCDVEYDYNSDAWKRFGLDITENLKTQKLTITATVPDTVTDVEPTPIKCLKLVLPEMLNVSIIAHHLDLRVKNKLLGDFIIQSSGGTVEVDKLRGENIVMACPESDVIVNKLLEGSSIIDSKSLKAKMINGESVQLKAMGSINVGAMYSLESALRTTKGDVHVGLMQGNTKVLTEKGDVSIMGVDGSFEIDVTKGNITLQVNKLNSSSSKQQSTAITLDGNVHTTVDPELVSTVTLESFTSNIQVLSDAFDRVDPNCEALDSVVGTLTGESKGLKRPTFYRGDGAGASGKIDMRGAENQSMHSVSPSEDTQGTPALKLVALGSVKLETMSWIEAIRRKHMTGGPVMPEIPMGKRALAFQRLKDTAAAAEAAAAANVIATAASVIQTAVPLNTQPLDSESAKVSLNLDNIPGMQTAGEKYVIMFTCNVCETRAARKISKKAYNTGVVICRCENCKNLHLIADRMGVFEDESWDIQKHMTKLLEQENINIEQIGDLLEVTENDEDDNEDGPDDGEDLKIEDIDVDTLYSDKK